MFRSRRSATQAGDLEEEGRANLAALDQVIAGLSGVRTVEEATRAALETVRAAFGWAYGSFWAIDESDQTLRFAVESGDAGSEFREVTLEASFAEGVGLSGRAWATKDLFFTPDIGQMTDCVRAPAAQRAGVKSGVCFPLVVEGAVVGTMDFFATETLDLSAQRLGTLRAVGRIVGQTLEQIARSERVAADAADAAAVIGVLERLMTARTSERRRAALEAVREALGSPSARGGSTPCAGSAGCSARPWSASRRRSSPRTPPARSSRASARSRQRPGGRVGGIQSDTTSAIDAISRIAEAVESVNRVHEEIAHVIEEQGSIISEFLHRTGG